MTEAIYPRDALVLAPLSGFTDLPYRRAARRFGCVYAFTEMVDVSSLAYSRDKTRTMLRRGEEEPFLGVQLVGSDLENTAKAVGILNEYDFNVLDFNMGCPVPKVVKNGGGAALTSDLERAVRLLSLVRRLSRHPVSAKIRIVDRNDPEPTVRLVKALADAGAEVITVHGRVRDAFYSGAVAFDVISACREAVDIPVVANGGVMDRASYDELRARTGCDKVMIARGAMGNPWIFEEILHPDRSHTPSREELIDVMREHVGGMVSLYGELSALKMARKIIHDYLHGRGFPGSVRNRASFLCTAAEFDAFCTSLEMENGG